MAIDLTVTPEEVARARERTQANVPAATIKIGKLVNAYWDEIRRAPQEGKKVAWHVANPGTILEAAAGMPTLLHAAFAPYNTARRQETHLIRVANEDFGFLPDTCSYTRLHVGLVHAWNTGQIDKIPPELRIPKPDLVVVGRMCTEHSTLGELVARHAKCPLVVIDMCPSACQTEEDYRQRAKYIERQMREELIPAIEKVTGRPYNWDKLSEMVAITKEVATMRDEINQLMKHKPAPCSMFDLGIGIGSLVTQMGRPETALIYRELLDECKERVAKGIGVVPNEKYRLYWDGYTTWSLLGTIMRILGPRGGLPLAGRYVWSFWRHPEVLDPNDPLASICYDLARWFNPHIVANWAKDLIMELIEDYQLDGMIMLTLLTCRMWNCGQEEFAEMAERKYGIPHLIFPADMIDRSLFSEAQLKTRLEAFLEMIDARRTRYV